MCRHLAFVGDEPVILYALLFGAPHSLCDQAHHPRHQTSGHDNPDGWGVAWYGHPGHAPERYRTVTPIWDDAAFADRSRGLEGVAAIAAARLASPGSTLTESGNAPFVFGRWSFSLNGFVRDFHDGAGDELRALLEAGARIEGDTDTEVLFALVLQRIDAGDEPGAALADVIGRVTAITSGRLNLLLTDGRRVYGTRYGNSLFRHGSTLASEPLDDQATWREVSDESLVVVEARQSTTTSL